MRLRSLAVPLTSMCLMGMFQACLLNRSGDTGSTASGSGGATQGSAGMGGVTMMAGSGGSGGSGGAEGGAGGMSPDQSCPTNQFATGIDAMGVLQCAPITDTVKAAFNDNCSLYFGWRDQCINCTAPPAKWGFASSGTCTNGAGADNTCTQPTLGSESVNLFGLNLDGNVGGDDKFYLGFRCNQPADPAVMGPCPTGSYLSAVTPTGVECRTGNTVIVEYVRSHCDFYWGWRNACNGCTDPPTRWGRASNTTCTDGAGGDNICLSTTLSNVAVELFGMKTEATVNEDDKFYLGMHCAGAEPGGTTVANKCPEGELVMGINDDGTVQCASPEPAAETVVRDSCYAYLGWRDSCDGCTDDPSKWGRVSHNNCEAAVGTDNTCTTATLDTVTLTMFGLNTDNTVNDDDKFHIGLTCP